MSFRVSQMSTLLLLSCLFAAGSGTHILASQSASAAQRLIDRAIDAMGRDALLGVGVIEVEYSGHSYAIEQSERPEGPFIFRYNQGRQLRDYEHARLRIEASQRSVQIPNWSSPSTMITNRDLVAQVTAKGQVQGAWFQLHQAQRVLELSPERVLLTARDSPDVRLDKDTKLHGLPHHVVAFGWRGYRIRLLIGAHNALPAAIEVIGPDPLSDMWGTVTETTYFSYWNLESNGLRYPRQVDTFWNGLTKSSTILTKVTVKATQTSLPSMARLKVALISNNL